MDGQLLELGPELSRAWKLSQAGKVADAIRAYGALDAQLPEGLSFAPELAVLRDNVGSGSGRLVAPVPTEDDVYSFFLASDSRALRLNLKRVEIDGAVLKKNIAAFGAEFDASLHRSNLSAVLPHVFVMSTGRCGTVSLLRLLNGSNLIPHHTYWMMLDSGYRLEMMARLSCGDWTNDDAPRVWAACRAAEWLSAVCAGKPMVALNHLDTIFAPVFAAVHEEARFVYLRRDPVKAFRSFFGKTQWGGQLTPIEFTFAPAFLYRPLADNVIASLAWYFRFTEVFARAIGKLFPEQWMEISADALFAQDKSELDKLIAATGLQKRRQEVADHYASAPINEKRHKQIINTYDMKLATADFEREWEAVCRGK